MISLSGIVLSSLLALTVLTSILAAVEYRRWSAHHRRHDLYWSLGLGLVVVTLAEECIVYAGVSSEFLLQSYFLLVAVLVGVLSLGSAELALSPDRRRAYSVYLLGACAATGYFVFAHPVPLNVVNQGVITGDPGTGILLGSSLVTFPAAALMAGSALIGAVRARRWNLLYIAVGILVISAAGGLYIASFPVTLYYSEFVGVVLLFLGFLHLPASTPRSVGAPNLSGTG